LADLRADIARAKQVNDNTFVWVFERAFQDLSAIVNKQKNIRNYREQHGLHPFLESARTTPRAGAGSQGARAGEGRAGGEEHVVLGDARCAH
jgi:hypothetical protein